MRQIKTETNKNWKIRFTQINVLSRTWKLTDWHQWSRNSPDLLNAKGYVNWVIIRFTRKNEKLPGKSYK